MRGTLPPSMADRTPPLFAFDNSFARELTGAAMPWPPVPAGSPAAQ